MFNWFDELTASVEAGIKSGLESGMKSVAEMFMSGLEGWLQVPEPAEPFHRIRLFRPSVDRPIAQDGVSIEEDSWKIESYGEKSVLLFELAEPAVQECLLLCQSQVRTAHLYKPAKLTLSLQNSAGWTYSRHASVEGTTTWHLCKVPFHYKKEQFSGSARISVEFASGGVFWLKELEVLQAAVKQTSS